MFHQLFIRESGIVYDPDPKKQLKKEKKRATKLLKGHIVKKFRRFSTTSIVIEFEDGARFFVDMRENGLDLSITGNFDKEA